jgi:signal transduction histidine kinase
MTADITDANPPPEKQRFNRAVGWRLLAAFVLLALLPIIAGLIGWSNTRAVDQPLQRVLQITEAFGANDRSYRAWSRALNTLFARRENFASRVAFDETRGSIMKAVAGMRSSVESLQRSDFNGTAGQLLADHEAVEQTVAAVLELVEQRLDAQERQASNIARIYAATEHIDDISSRAAADAGSDRDLGRRLDTVRFNADAVRYQAREVSGLSANQDLAPRQAETASKFRVALNALAQLPDRPYRQELAIEFDELFERVLGTDGVFRTSQQILDLHAQQLEQEVAGRRQLYLQVNALGQMDRASEEQSRLSLQAAGEALRRADFTMLGVGALSSLFAVLLLQFLVRGNVLRRLNGLTRVTKKLNQGQLDRPVRIEGDDELAELAAALESFRRLALLSRKNEEILATRTRELVAMNKELDQFAYVASHDLKAPMRAIDSLADFLREDLRDVADADSMRHLDMMQQRIGRLESLLDSLLEYSRAGRHRSPPELVDVRELVEGCAELVLPRGRQFRYTGAAIRVYTWKTPLEQIVRNLIDNALKHTPDEQALITIDCAMQAGRLRITVEDEGPGIAPEFHERIFGMFQTLKPRDQVEGSGMGLAILKKLTETYGAEISVDSNPAERPGARFTVIWPTEAVVTVGGKSDFDQATLRALAHAS